MTDLQVREFASLGYLGEYKEEAWCTMSRLILWLSVFVFAVTHVGREKAEQMEYVTLVLRKQWFDFGYLQFESIRTFASSVLVLRRPSAVAPAAARLASYLLSPARFLESSSAA